MRNQISLWKKNPWHFACSLLFILLTHWNSTSFFFQAEDGIRDIGVTGVQTCALPISFIQPLGFESLDEGRRGRAGHARSEERRVGKECRAEWRPDHQNKQLKHDK